MIELKRDRLEFSFPEVHPAARLTIEFQRTLRIPDDGHDYRLPPGLGRFPLVHVDDYAAAVPPTWIDHGGVMLPIYQAEAMWINFRTNYDDTRRTDYPFAVKIAAGRICAVSGEAWRDGLRRPGEDRPEGDGAQLTVGTDPRWSTHHGAPQNYLVVPDQPWLDGFAVERDVIRQFVAMPLGSGYSAEEQITGEAEFGGVQIQVFPMRRDEYEKRFPPVPPAEADSQVLFQSAYAGEAFAAAPDMGLAPGGRMRQQIYADTYGVDAWDRDTTSRCFVHLANSETWTRITSTPPPTQPPSVTDYINADLPWFDWYDEKPTVAGTEALRNLKSVGTAVDSETRVREWE
jgi:hypothetical protein